jgi:hypothetical protein
MKSSMDANVGGVDDARPAAVHSTSWPFRTKEIVRLPKSQRIGPRDSAQWTPSTMSYEPKASL